jgi:hypothetical protein
MSASVRQRYAAQPQLAASPSACNVQPSAAVHILAGGRLDSGAHPSGTCGGCDLLERASTKGVPLTRGARAQSVTVRAWAPQQSLQLEGNFSHDV